MRKSGNLVPFIKKKGQNIGKQRKTEPKKLFAYPYLC